MENKTANFLNLVAVDNLEFLFYAGGFCLCEGGGVSIVSKKWLTPRKKEVFWPPYKEQTQFNRSLKKAEEINTETWRVYNVHRIFYETDNYDEAVKKLKKVEDTSDLQTDEEETYARKRPISKPKRLFDSDSSEEEEKLPPPPKIKRTLFSDNTEVQKSGRTDRNLSELMLGSGVHTRPQTISEKTAVSESVTVPEKTAFQIILENVLDIKNQNKIILGKLTKLCESARETNVTPELPVKLPLTTLEHVDILEDFLQERNNENLLIAYFSGLGGEGINSKTNRILKEALDDSVAKYFNFYGRNKRRFYGMKLCSCVVDAVKSSCGCTTADVEKAIKVWLKHAPQRLEAKNKKNQNNVIPVDEVQ